MSPNLIELHNASFGYDTQPVLQHVSLSVERGEFTVLVGPNGAGKTTLLRGVLGLIPVLSGRVVYHFDRKASPPGYVPQRDSLDSIFPLSAMEVVLMGTYAKLPPLWPVGRAGRQRAAQCLEQVGLATMGKRPFWTLSGGQRQRVLIARALAAEPEVLFLDEPTAGVDHEAETAIAALITELNRTHGLTVMLVTHHLDRIRSSVHSTILVDDGVATRRRLDVQSAP
ncbi:MAG: ABC transporter ATP-binding protein [Deltaproteobacteria bacterium]|nr:ABC transporter ATP-binding protein [Deltaproteobacteria bacterium]